jgi:hypothetical protein
VVPSKLRKTGMDLLYRECKTFPRQVACVNMKDLNLRGQAPLVSREACSERRICTVNAKR